MKFYLLFTLYYYSKIFRLSRKILYSHQDKCRNDATLSLSNLVYITLDTSSVYICCLH